MENGMTDTTSEKLIVPAFGGVYAATPVFEALLRFVVGFWLVPHGAQKLFGLFGGGGISGTAGFFSQIGLEPAVLLATLAGAGEFFGGLLLAIGLLTRPAALVSVVILAVATLSVHIGNGFFMANGGFEYATLWFFAALYFVFKGGNEYSVDAKLGRSF
jgi:putative oxidoreductase